ncbi:FMN reductase [Mumia zhuanghuii]|jgi:FMN reductase|uniref:NADPH-dependent FMN reductase n=1 Tax=Mumia zhuanghuii TaxID=2585211 RepID=A0A5C4MTD0_9ACTN|nr:FMN reductase [Mumia zhuanghuii]TNC46114.1 NADPH-dependent FMN reductase [Mumia zhuanghuii]TNC48861.1 NADPH-dependent FMN reductase [Mumia zhuanghuii]
MTTRTITVVSAGLSQPSSTRLLGDRLAQAVRDDLLTQGVEAEVTVHELREHAHDITNAMLTGFAPAGLQPVIDDVVASDGLVVVTPIFTASYSGLFKSFFDVLDKEALAGKPVLLGATAGTARHSLALEHALRPMFAYLRAVVVPTAVFAASEDWGGIDGLSGALQSRITRAAGELSALVATRAATAPADPFALTTSFEELLSGSGS